MFWVSRFNGGYTRLSPVLDGDGDFVSVPRYEIWKYCCAEYGCNPNDPPRFVRREDGSVIYLHLTFTPRKR